MEDKKQLKKDVNEYEYELKGLCKEEYGYNFVPALHQWTNIDEQKKGAKRLENMTGKKE